MLDDFFDGSPEDYNIAKVKGDKASPFLYPLEDVGHRDYVFVLDKIPSSKNLSLLKLMINKHLSDDQYKILYALKITYIDKDVKTKYKFYSKYSIDFEKLIGTNSKVFSFGDSILALTKSGDLNHSTGEGKQSIIEGFYDVVEWNTSFYHPKLKSRVFPVDSLQRLINSKTNFWLDNFETWFLKKQLRISKQTLIGFQRTPQIQETILKTKEEIKDFLLLHKDETSGLGLDTETNMLDQFHPNFKITDITFCYYNEPYHGYLIDYTKVCDDKEIISLLHEFLYNRKLYLTNCGFDFKAFVMYTGLDIDQIVLGGDTIHLTQIYNNTLRRGLKPGAWMFTGFGGYDQALEDYKETHPRAKKNYSLIPNDIRWPYAIKDPCVTCIIHKELMSRIEKLNEKFPVEFVENSIWSLKYFYEELRLPSIMEFIRAEIQGIEIDWEIVRQNGVKARRDIKELSSKIKKELGVSDSFDLGKPQDLSNHLQNTLKWRDYGIDKKGYYNINKFSLEKWEKEGKSVAGDIAKLHGMITVYNTFIGDEKEGTGYWKYRKADGRVHASHGVGLTNSSRSNCKDPNNQNLPKKGYMAKEIRKQFIIDLDKACILESDGAGLQLRITASLSKDEKMTQAFIDGKDLHSVTAQNLFMKDISIEEFMERLDNKDKEAKRARQSSKAPNFALIFLCGPMAFAQNSLYSGYDSWTLEDCKAYVIENNLEENRIKLLGYIRNMTKEDAIIFSYYYACGDDIRKKWLATYPGVVKYQEQRVEEGMLKGFIASPFGYMRRTHKLKYISGKDCDGSIVKNIKNITTNSPTQTMEWIIVMKVIIAFGKAKRKNKWKSSLMTNVHDSIVIYCYYDELKAIQSLLTEVFEEDIPEMNGVPYLLESEAGIWGFGEEIKKEDLEENFEETIKLIKKNCA